MAWSAIFVTPSMPLALMHGLRFFVSSMTASSFCQMFIILHFISTFKLVVELCSYMSMTWSSLPTTLSALPFWRLVLVNRFNVWSWSLSLLGTEVSSTSNGFFISQEKYIQDLLAHAALSDKVIAESWSSSLLPWDCSLFPKRSISKIFLLVLLLLMSAPLRLRVNIHLCSLPV